MGLRDIKNKLENILKKLDNGWFNGMDKLFSISGMIQDVSEKYLPKFLVFIISALLSIITFQILIWVWLFVMMYVTIFIALPIKLIIGVIEDIEYKRLSLYSVGLVGILLFVSVCIYYFNSENYDDNEYFICTGRYSKVYHKMEFCDGLDNCGGEVISVSKDDYRVKNRRRCKICY